MRTYHKIQSVFLRDPATNHKTFLDGQWTLPAFGYLANCEWAWTEKVDGTNIRVHWNGSEVTFGGRTENAQIQAPLVNRLRELFPADRFAEHFPLADADNPPDVMLVGEGYGHKIQKGGGNYLPDRCDFVLFDVQIGDVWLERDNIEDVGRKMATDVVPIVGSGTLHEAIARVRDGFASTWGEFTAEGLVVRPVVEMRTRMGSRVITKIKHRDFRA